MNAKLDNASSTETTSWVVRFPDREVILLGSFRQTGTFHVCTSPPSIWLRGIGMDPGLFQRLHSIPNAELFFLHSEDLLVRPKETVPSLRMPTGPWEPLSEWLTVRLPPVGFAACIRERATLTLVRDSSSPETANVLRTTLAAWRDYADTAPQIRLNRLGFAVSDQKDVLIRGTPLPPIVGRRHVERDGIILPSGWRFEPDVGTPLIRELLMLDQGMLALFSEDVSFERLSQTAFIQATRNAVRLTHG